MSLFEALNEENDSLTPLNGVKTDEESKPYFNGTTAREAYEGNDGTASKMYHKTKSEEAHQFEGGLLKPVIFGGLDGILTSFAIVAGAAGGNLPAEVILVLGFSNILADALSMGVGEFLSSKANNEWIINERRREAWEMDNYPEGEIEEMIQIFEAKGMNLEDATSVVQTMAKYKEFFVDIMMTHELDLSVPEEDHMKTSIQEGLIMFTSFAVFGSMPLLGYIIIPVVFSSLGPEPLFLAACAVTAVVLFILGSVKSRFCIQSWYSSGAETLLLGGACATVAYSVAHLLSS